VVKSKNELKRWKRGEKREKGKKEMTREIDDFLENSMKPCNESMSSSPQASRERGTGERGTSHSLRFLIEKRQKLL